MSNKVFYSVYSGKTFDLMEITEDDINLTDIASSLSKQCRYNGHCSSFYSVAQHSVLLSYFVPAPLALNALMHDAAEAYIGDFHGLFKKMLLVDTTSNQRLTEFESNIQKLIARKFDLPEDFAESVHDWDQAILVYEMQTLFPRHELTFHNYREDYLEHIQNNPYVQNGLETQSDVVAQLSFLSRYNYLISE